MQGLPLFPSPAGPRKASRARGLERKDRPGARRRVLRLPGTALGGVAFGKSPGPGRRAHRRRSLFAAGVHGVRKYRLFDPVVLVGSMGPDFVRLPCFADWRAIDEE